MTESENREKLPVAVALQYDIDKDQAPRVTAKGKGAIAENIVRIAEENGITIREDANLVEILAKIDIDTMIPLEAYSAVAEILNYVYTVNAKNKHNSKKV